jgi:hypothetical protein
MPSSGGAAGGAAASGERPETSASSAAGSGVAGDSIGRAEEAAEAEGGPAATLKEGAPRCGSSASSASVRRRSMAHGARAARSGGEAGEGEGPTATKACL